jgi:glycosyltransferase involved in cell wall biosynthesis
VRGLQDITFDELKPLSEGLPRVACLTTLPWGPISRIGEGLLASGVDLTIGYFDSSKQLYAEKNSLLKDRVFRFDKKSLYMKYSVLQNLFVSKYPGRPGNFEPVFPGISLGIDFSRFSQIADAEILLVVDGIVVPDLVSAGDFLNGKKLGFFLSCMPLVTGLCSYTGGCKKWKTLGCESCPQLGPSRDGADPVREFFAQKYNALQGLSGAVVTPSRWLGENAKESILLRSFHQTTIPTCVNLDFYAPQPREFARNSLGLPRERKIILCGAGNWNRKNKGIQLMPDTLRILAGIWKGVPPVFAFFGANFPKGPFDGYDYVDLGYFDDVEKLRAAYSAADVFVSPSFEDNLPNTVNEALSCGTPVVCFDRWSSEDVVKNGINGYVAEHPGLPLSADGTLTQDPPYSAEPSKLEDLAAKIQKIIELPCDEYQLMRANCRKKALEDFSPVLQAARYVRLFRKIQGLPEVQIEGLPV